MRVNLTSKCTVIFAHNMLLHLQLRGMMTQLLCLCSLQKLWPDNMSITTLWVRLNCITINILHIGTEMQIKSRNGQRLKLSHNAEVLGNRNFQRISRELTSPMHPKYSRSIHWNTEGPVKIQIPCPTLHRKPLVEACSNSALWQSTRLSWHYAFFLQSPIHPLHIFQLPQ